ncbi:MULTISPECIES: hypothetical protein [unclassified Bacillus (in: firmicutes)]|uniref:hypothetical protein n=1 Tax=unclassified Bacillus (in: firmicutes) TaxID=185979 RepID=UPI000B897FFD|nr:MULTISPECIES: hypothetical protein [unclassified Bacillus (in: firmicutes)]
MAKDYQRLIKNCNQSFFVTTQSLYEKTIEKHFFKWPGRDWLCIVAVRAYFRHMQSFKTEKGSEALAHFYLHGSNYG